MHPRILSARQQIAVSNSVKSIIKTWKRGMKFGDSSETTLNVQSREELSFLGWEARLCSLPTTHCDPFTPPTKPSRIIHVQIKFPAEVQFHIHKAAKLKQKTSGSIIEPWQTF